MVQNQKKREAVKQEYEEKQMLRFGDLIDLDSLEVSGPSPQVLKLQIDLNKKEWECIKKVEEKSNELETTQRHLTESVSWNTFLLHMIIELGNK